MKEEQVRDGFMELLCFLAKEEQCQAAWTHMMQCPRCERVVTFAIMGGALVGTEAKDPKVFKDKRVEIVQELLSPEEFTQFVEDQLKKQR